MMKSLLYVLFLLLVTKDAYGAWVLEVELQNITFLHEVTYDKDQDMYCCCDEDSDDNQYCFADLQSSNCTTSRPGRCDSLITACLDYDGDSMRDCVTTNNDHKSGSVFSFFAYVSSEQNTYSQLQFPGSNYPSNGSLGLNITIEEDDGKNDPKVPIDTIMIQWEFETRSSSVNTYTSDRSIAQMGIATRLYCASNYFGADCETYCELMNDDDKGHYACDSSGEKICLLGYMNPETNCTEPIVQVNTTEQAIVTTQPQVNETVYVQTEVESSCTSWRISIGVLSLVVAFILGICCTSACLLVFLRQYKTKQKSDRRSNNVATLNINNGADGGGLCNPLYNDSQLQEKWKDGKLEGYESMKPVSSGAYESRNVLMSTTNQELEYDTVTNQGRSNFSKLSTPNMEERKEISPHSYESISLNEEENDKDNKQQEVEEYSKLTRLSNNYN